MGIGGKGSQYEEVKVKPADICLREGRRCCATSVREDQSGNRTENLESHCGLETHLTHVILLVQTGNGS